MANENHSYMIAYLRLKIFYSTSTNSFEHTTPTKLPVIKERMYFLLKDLLSTYEVSILIKSLLKI